MNLAAEHLPDDVASLHDMLRDLLRERQQKDQRIQLLEEQLRLLRHKQFGASSEKATGHGELFNEAEQDGADDAIEAAGLETQSLATAPVAKRTKAAGRKPLPADLPRIRIEHDLAEIDKTCVCGCLRTLIGEETSAQLDIVPAQLRVLVQVRQKYVCKACETGVAIAPLLVQPIPKSNASPGLLAYVAIAKYQDGLPLHRQEHIFQRLNIDLPRNNSEIKRPDSPPSTHSLQ